VQRGWGYTCEVEGETKRVYLPAHQLHATEPPPEGCNTGPPDRKLLGTVPVTKVQDFLHNWHTTAGNPDLQRRKPSSGLMLELTLRTRSITDLSDDDVQALHYEAAGSRIQQDQRLQGGEQPSVPGHLLAPVAPALGSPTSPLLPSLSFSPPLPAVDKNASIADIRIGLQKAVLGKWKHVWMCAHARKCACPFTLEFKHDGTGTVSIWQSGSQSGSLAVWQSGSLAVWLQRITSMQGASLRDCQPGSRLSINSRYRDAICNSGRAPSALQALRPRS
jgi:hypothetical protein